MFHDNPPRLHNSPHAMERAIDAFEIVVVNLCKGHVSLVEIARLGAACRQFSTNPRSGRMLLSIADWGRCHKLISLRGYRAWWFEAWFYRSGNPDECEPHSRDFGVLWNHLPHPSWGEPKVLGYCPNCHFWFLGDTERQSLDSSVIVQCTVEPIGVFGEAPLPPVANQPPYTMPLPPQVRETL
jgi:hypothetical protein